MGGLIASSAGLLLKTIGLKICSPSCPCAMCILADIFSTSLLLRLTRI
jgi:hypothetical protein